MVNEHTLSQSDPSTTINYTLDNLGRATTISNSISGLTPTVAFNKAFDTASNRTELKATIGSTLTGLRRGQTRDSRNVGKACTLVNEHTPSQSDPSTTINYTLDNLGRATTISNSISGPHRRSLLRKPSTLLAIARS